MADYLRLVLVGKSGVGKSSTGNTILNGSKFKADIGGSSVSVSTYTAPATVNGRKIKVTDTPGLFDTRDEIKAERGVVNALKKTHPGPHAVLYVISVIGGRYDKNEHEAYLRIKQYLGEAVTKHMIVTFTHGDELSRKNKTVEEWLQSAPPRLKQVLEECGGRYVLFNNTAGADGSAVHSLFELIDTLDGEHYTGSPYAGKAQKEVKEELDRRRELANKRQVESNPYGVRITQDLDQEKQKTKALQGMLDTIFGVCEAAGGVVFAPATAGASLGVTVFGIAKAAVGVHNLMS